MTHISFTSLVSVIETTFNLAFDDCLSVAFDLITIGTAHFAIADEQLAEQIDAYIERLKNQLANA